MSKKLPGIRLFSIELEIGGKTSAKGAKTLQQFLATGLARDRKLAHVRDVDLDLIALAEFQRLGNGGGEPDGGYTSVNILGGPPTMPDRS